MGLMLQSYKVTLLHGKCARKAAKVIFGARFLRNRGHDIMVRYKAAIKRVQSHARMNSAERKQARC